jgi:putative nucleotidyltransferase with HDIG domain
MVQTKDIAAVFHEQLAGISDQELRDMTVQVWVDACEQGNWDSIEEVKKIPFTLLTPSRGIGLIEHTIAVTEGAAGLAEAQIDACDKLPYEIDMDLLIAGGLLHDVGKLLEIEKNPEGGFRKSRSGRYARHPISGAILAAKAGLPDEVINIVACHAKEGEGRPKVVETVLVHQADFATFDPLVMLEKGTLIQ